MDILNIEIKARCPDLDRAARVCDTLGARFTVEEIQEDTFYNVPSGRLKLRRSSSLGAMLIHYHRPDEPGMKPSTGARTDIPDPDPLHAILSAALGIRSVVRKRRHVYWLRNAKIHLDTVDDLGNFLEIEIVLARPQDEPDGRLLMQQLLTAFSVRDADLVPVAYTDLLKP